MPVLTEVNGVEVKSCATDAATRKRVNEDIRLRNDELPNQDPVLRKAGIEIDAYELTASDVRVGGAIQNRNAPVLSSMWDVLPKTENDQDLTPPDQIKIIKELFSSYNMRNQLANTQKAAQFGYQPFEINDCIVGDLILPLEFIAKPARWFRYNQENELVLRTRNRLNTEPLPPNKFIVARNNPTFDNPYGENFLGKCFWPAIFRSNGKKWWTIFTEKYGMPWVDAAAKDGVKEEDIQIMADKFAQMVQDGVIAHEDNWTIQLLQAANLSGEAYEKYIADANEDIAIAVLSTNLTTEVKGGSLAAASIHNGIRKEIVEADRKIAEQVFNELIDHIYMLNPWDTQLKPTFVLFGEAEVKLEQAKRDESLVKANPGLRFNEKYYINNFNLQEDEFELTEPVAPTGTIDPNTNVEE